MTPRAQHRKEGCHRTRAGPEAQPAGSAGTGRGPQPGKRPGPRPACVPLAPSVCRQPAAPPRSGQQTGMPTERCARAVLNSAALSPVPKPHVCRHAQDLCERLQRHIPKFNPSTFGSARVLGRRAEQLGPGRAWPGGPASRRSKGGGRVGAPRGCRKSSVPALQDTIPQPALGSRGGRLGLFFFSVSMQRRLSDAFLLDSVALGVFAA